MGGGHVWDRTWELDKKKRRGKDIFSGLEARQAKFKKEGGTEPSALFYGRGWKWGEKGGRGCFKDREKGAETYLREHLILRSMNHLS